MFPSLAEIKNLVVDRVGGCCYVLNVFMRELLRGFGFSTYYARCAIHGVDDCHIAIVVRGLLADTPTSLHMVDVGCGYIMPKPISLTFDGDESPVHTHGFLRIKFIRGPGGTLLRLHARTSTFERSELTLQRSDGFDHVFWSMSLAPRALHDAGETQQRRAFTSFHKLRAAIGVGSGCRMVYFKGDNHYGSLMVRVMSEDCDGALVGEALGDNKRDIVARLCGTFPMFPEGIIRGALDALGTV